MEKGRGAYRPKKSFGNRVLRFDVQYILGSFRSSMQILMLFVKI